MPKFSDSDIKLNARSSDFIGLNFYNGNIAPPLSLDILNPKKSVPIYDELLKDVTKDLPDPMVCPNWWNGGSAWIYHTPYLFRYQIRDWYRQYKLPILITENGISELTDWIKEPEWDDWWRRRQLVEYIGQEKFKNSKEFIFFTKLQNKNKKYSVEY